MILKSLLSVLLLLMSVAVGAQEPGAGGSNEAHEYHPWRAVSVNMSPEEYEQISRGNRRFLRQIVTSQTTAALFSLGVSENGIGMLGAAAALAFDQDAKLTLNRSKSLAVQFSDMTQQERAVQIGYTLRW